MPQRVREMRHHTPWKSPAVQKRFRAVSLVVASCCLLALGAGLHAESSRRAGGDGPAGNDPAASADSGQNTPQDGVGPRPLDSARSAVGQSDRSIPAKIFRYCRRLVKRYDADGNGRLTEGEWSRMRGEPRRADFNLDGAITREELAQHVADYGRRRKISLAKPPWGMIPELPPLLHPTTRPDTPNPTINGRTDGSDDMASATEPAAQPDPSAFGPRGDRRFAARLPKGLPDWFIQRDADGDGQLTTDEFAPKGARTQLDQFARYDANGDGVVTAKEYLRAAKAKGGS